MTDEGGKDSTRSEWPARRGDPFATAASMGLYVMEGGTVHGLVLTGADGQHLCGSVNASDEACRAELEALIRTRALPEGWTMTPSTTEQLVLAVAEAFGLPVPYLAEIAQDHLDPGVAEFTAGEVARAFVASVGREKAVREACGLGAMFKLGMLDAPGGAGG